MRTIIIYDNDTIINSYKVNTIQAIELINSLLSGTEFNISIINED